MAAAKDCASERMGFSIYETNEMHSRKMFSSTDEEVVKPLTDKEFIPPVTTPHLA